MIRLSQLTPLFIEQDLYGRGHIEIVVPAGGPYAGGTWTVSLDGNTHERLLAEGDALALASRGSTLAVVSLDTAENQTESGGLLVDLADAINRHCGSGMNTLVDACVDCFAEVASPLPSLLLSSLQSLLRIRGEREPAPLLVIRQAQAEWFPWELVPILKGHSHSVLGHEFALTRELAPHLRGEQGSYPSKTHLVPPEEADRRALLVFDHSRWRENKRECLDTVRVACGDCELVEPEDATLEWLLSTRECFCWAVFLTHHDPEKGLETGPGVRFQLDPNCAQRPEFRRRVKDRFVLLAACAAAVALQPNATGSIEVTRDRTWRMVVGPLQQPISIAGTFFAAGASCVVAAMCDIVDTTTCDYIADLMARIRVFDESAPVAMHRLRQTHRSIAEYPALAFCCHGAYTTNRRCAPDCVKHGLCPVS
jgi:hypothetical protein